jgi:DNA (cytosine-5)-methyltransferase 1
MATMKIVERKNESPKDIRVIELFAGVGGFRIGLEGFGKRHRKGFRTVWSNQWEPSTHKQHASDVYVARFGKEGHSNTDISKVPMKDIPDHDLLVGGFPCQDYSVARTLNQAKGLQGKKGVLWWEIYRILKEKGKKAPPYLFLENVDRLLRSPASARGRDFAIMLASLADLGYVVEWRVINAAEYGKPQRRKRTFILGYKKDTKIGKEMLGHLNEPLSWMLRHGVIATGFPVEHKIENEHIYYDLGKDATSVSANFKERFPDDVLFLNTGMMIDGHVYTVRTVPTYKGEKMTLGDVILPDKNVPEEYFIPDKDLKSWKYLKGAKNEPRKSKSGFEYHYSEGNMHYPDPLDTPSRTIITAEGGSTPSRFKHVIKTRSGRLRRLTPIELERLCQFPDDHTKLEGVADTRRAFFMGNALVVGIIEDMGKALLKKIKEGA